MSEIELAPFLFKLALIFMPGIVSRVILGKLLYYKSDTSFYFMVHSFVLGCLCYFILYLICIIAPNLMASLSFNASKILIGAIFEDNSKVNYYEVLLVCIISVPLAFTISYAEQNKWLFRSATKLKVTNRFSEPDVWGYLFNSPELTTHPWVTVRNKKSNLMYQGKVLAFSDTVDFAEIYLADVNVYNNATAESLYSSSGVYLTLEPKDIEIEFFLSNNVEEGGSKSGR